MSKSTVALPARASGPIPVSSAIRSIVVPVDGSPLSEGALNTALALGKRLGARVHPVLVHVPLPSGLQVPGSFDSATNIESALLAGSRRHVERIEQNLRGLHDEPVTVTVLRSRAPTNPFGEPAAVAQVLQRFARERRADMIVMASHGIGGASRAWLGSVTDTLIRQLEVPVLVLRGQHTKTDASFGHVLVPLDGSSASEKMLPIALAVAAGSDARLTVLQVWEPSTKKVRKVPLVSVDRADVHTRELRRRMRDLQVSMPELRGVKLAAVTAKSPARGIFRFAAEHDVDLIAMTTRGRGGAARLVLGSVADKIVRGSPTAVLVLKPVSK